MSGVGNTPVPSGLDAEQLAAMSAAGDMLKIIAEMIVGYRRTLVDGGVGASVADEMAREFHSRIVAQMSGNR